MIPTGQKPPVIAVATANPGKLREITEILADTGWLVRSMAEYGFRSMPEETGATYPDNARIKAEALLHAIRRQGGSPDVSALAALADDSGLEVASLGGRPGVLSARFGSARDDAERNRLLLKEMEATGNRNDRARFVCVLALVLTDGSFLWTEGICPGRITPIPQGNNGFGYDPIFIPDGMGGRTMAELTPREKNRISHRGKALKAMAELLRKQPCQ